MANCSICGKKFSAFDDNKFFYDSSRLPKSFLCLDCEKLLRSVKQRDMSKENAVVSYSEAVDTLKRNAAENSADAVVKSEILALVEEATHGYPTYLDYRDAVIAEHFPAADSHNLGGVLFINQSTRQFSIATEDGLPGQIHDFDDLIDFKIAQDGETITGSVVGKAVAGALIAGAAGAIVGSSMARKSTRIARQLDIILSYRGLEAPMETIRLLVGPIDRGSSLYAEKVQLCDQITFALKQIMDSGQDAGMKSERGARAIYAFSVADEIQKFKQLADDGVITQAEFETQKQKLLSLDY